MSVEHANNVTLECCVVHHFLRTKAISNAPTTFMAIIKHNGNVVNGPWREDLTNLMSGIRRTNARNHSANALRAKGHLIEYFNTTGRVIWQDVDVRRTKIFHILS